IRPLWCQKLKAAITTAGSESSYYSTDMQGNQSRPPDRRSSIFRRSYQNWNSSQNATTSSDSGGYQTSNYSYFQVAGHHHPHQGLEYFQQDLQALSYGSLMQYQHHQYQSQHRSSGRGGSIFRYRPYNQQGMGGAGPNYRHQRNYSSSCNSASPSLRRWKQFADPNSSPLQPENSRHVDFRVLSYNILAQCHLEFNPHLYSHVRNPRWLNWPLRRLNLLSDIRCLRADVLCLQEVEPDAYANYFERELSSLGFEGCYLAKTGKALDGCAIFWRRDVFRLDKYTPVEFYREDLPAMAYHNVAQVAVLSLLSNPSSQIAIANTHLLFNPNRGDAKLLQSANLLATLASTVAPETPVILCGDLNSQPNSALFHLFLEGSLSLDKLLVSDISMQNATSFLRRRSQAYLNPELIKRAGFTFECQFKEADSESISAQRKKQEKAPPTELVLSHQLSFQSAYDYRDSNNLFTITSYTAQDSCTVDAIFYSSGRTSVSNKTAEQTELKPTPVPLLQCLAQLNLLTPRQLNQIGGIPNRLQSSDHLPLCAQFRLLLLSGNEAAESGTVSSKL
ncbi:hypothetical protein BOX15_Mlig026040g6, partial [Macrostomum lignano]